MTKKQIEYAKRYGKDDDEIAKLEKQLADLEPIKPVFHTNGFQHYKIPVITDRDPNLIQFFQWGLIPFWTKDLKSGMTFSNKTLNARGETIFEKASYKHAAKKRRCIIIVDGFFEHHHFSGKTYPFHIQLKDESPMSLAGLWEKWVDKETGEVFQTVTIVTTVGNSMMAKIHNNPKATGPRMPFILDRESEHLWLKESSDEQELELIKNMIQPLDESLLQAYSVAPVRGKAASGNTKKAIEKLEYGELMLLGF